MKTILFTLLIAAVVIGCQSHQACEQCSDNKNSSTFKTAYQNAFKVGVAINEDIAQNKPPELSQIVRRQFNSVTAENVMKAEIINPTPNTFNFAPADQFVDFAQKNNMFIIGHTLVWHNQTPDWFFQNSDGTPHTPEQQIELMHNYIKTVAGRYADKIQAWDVVNEVIGDDGNYRPTKWVNAVGSGDELVKNAFRFASQYAPDTELYYNDFNAWRPEKVAGIVRMVKMLQASNIRIDGIGIQAHWGLNFPKTEYIQAAIDAYSDLGVKVMITEMDMDVLPLTREGQIIGTGMLHPQFELEEFELYLDPYQSGLPQKVQQQLTERYLELFKLFYKNREKIDRVTFWGVHDSMSWKNDYPIANRTNYPLLYNRDLSPKPVVSELLSLPQKID